MVKQIILQFWRLIVSRKVRKWISLLATIIMIASAGYALFEGSHSILPKEKKTDIETRIDAANYYVTEPKMDGFKYGKPSGIRYGDLDFKGRPTYVSAEITRDLYLKEKAESREPINVDPIGWGRNFKAEIDLGNGKYYHGYFWNRSHMLADSLGGEPIQKNLVTGTRMQNVGIDHRGGMAYIESKIRDYFDNGGKETVYFELTNNYGTDEEIIPRAATIRVLSKDKTFNETVTVYNACNGYDINYESGDVKKIGD